MHISKIRKSKKFDIAFIQPINLVYNSKQVSSINDDIVYTSSESVESPMYACHIICDSDIAEEARGFRWFVVGVTNKFYDESKIKKLTIQSSYREVNTPVFNKYGSYYNLLGVTMDGEFPLYFSNIVSPDSGYDAVHYINGDTLDCRSVNIITEKEYKSKQILYDFVYEYNDCVIQRTERQKYFLEYTGDINNIPMHQLTRYICDVNKIKELMQQEIIKATESSIDRLIESIKKELSLIRGSISKIKNGKPRRDIDIENEFDDKLNALINKYTKHYYESEVHLDLSIYDEKEIDRVLNKYNELELIISAVKNRNMIYDFNNTETKYIMSSPTMRAEISNIISDMITGVSGTYSDLESMYITVSYDPSEYVVSAHIHSAYLSAEGVFGYSVGSKDAAMMRPNKKSFTIYIEPHEVLNISNALRKSGLKRVIVNNICSVKGEGSREAAKNKLNNGEGFDDYWTTTLVYNNGEQYKCTTRMTDTKLLHDLIEDSVDIISNNNSKLKIKFSETIPLSIIEKFSRMISKSGLTFSTVSKKFESISRYTPIDSNYKYIIYKKMSKNKRILLEKVLSQHVNEDYMCKINTFEINKKRICSLITISTTANKYISMHTVVDFSNDNQ